MKNKELLAYYKKLREQYLDMKKKPSSTLDEGTSMGKQKSIGTAPGIPNMGSEGKKKDAAFAQIFMLSFLTLLFQILFLGVCYVIYH